MFYIRYVRLTLRTFDRGIVREVAPLAAGAGVVGGSFGAVAVAAGMPWWMPSLMSAAIFAGGSQFLAVGVIASGGGAAAAVIAALLLNARHLPFGLAIGDVFGRTRTSRLIGSHLLIDESAAFALTHHDPRRARTAFWVCGAAIFLTWNLGTLAGALAGQAMADPAVFGVDAAFPAAMLALTLPNLRDRPTIRAAVAGAAIAVVSAPFVPGGVPVLLALLGLFAAGRPRDHEREAGS